MTCGSSGSPSDCWFYSFANKLTYVPMEYGQLRRHAKEDLVRVWKSQNVATFLITALCKHSYLLTCSLTYAASIRVLYNGPAHPPLTVSHRAG